MYMLKTKMELKPETRERLRKSFKEHTGEDCLILDCGLTLEYVPTKKEQPLFRRLFRRD